MRHANFKSGLWLLTGFFLAAGIVLAQFPGDSERRRSWRRGGDRAGVPEWERDKVMPHDKFTFARIRYSSGGSGFGGRGGLWNVDYPNSDLNFSYRLEQLTALKADPDGTVVDFTEEDLMNYPFVYITDPRAMSLEKEEVKGFRDYLLNGGFFMVDDFWSEPEWENFYREMKRVFPEIEPVDLEFDHPIFSYIFPLKEKPQVPSEDWYRRRFETPQEALANGVTWETKNSYRTMPPKAHFYAYFDKNDRMMGLACHNTDIGDGWEEEGASPWYFKNFSEPKSYPMGINILFYAMTH